MTQNCFTSTWSTISDTALVVELVARKDAAWRELLRRCGGAVKGRVAYLLKGYGPCHGSSDSCQEILAEFYLSLFENDMKKVRAYDVASGLALSSWLALLAEHHTRNHFRALAVRAMVSIRTDQEDAGSTGQGARWCGAGTEDLEFADTVRQLGLRLDEVV